MDELELDTDDEICSTCERPLRPNEVCECDCCDECGHPLETRRHCQNCAEMEDL